MASLNGEIRSAIAEYITSHKDKVREKAEEALAEIEREAEAKRAAIAALFGEACADAASHMESGVAPSPGVDPMNRRLAGTGKAS